MCSFGIGLAAADAVQYPGSEPDVAYVDWVPVGKGEVGVVESAASPMLALMNGQIDGPSLTLGYTPSTLYRLTFC